MWARDHDLNIRRCALSVARYITLIMSLNCYATHVARYSATAARDILPNAQQLLRATCCLMLCNSWRYLIYMNIWRPIYIYKDIYMSSIYIFYIYEDIYMSSIHMEDILLNTLQLLVATQVAWYSATIARDMLSGSLQLLRDMLSRALQLLRETFCQLLCNFCARHVAWWSTTVARHITRASSCTLTAAFYN